MYKRQGSGKTTLLKTLRGLYPASGGQVLWDGKSIASMSDKDIAHHVAYMQQSVNVSFDYEAIDIVMTCLLYTSQLIRIKSRPM